MMRFPKLDKLQIWHLDAIGAGVALLLAGVAYLLLIQPLIDASRLRQAQAAELIAEQTKRQDAEKALRASEDQLANVQAYITDLKLPLEPTTRMNEHLSGLTELAIKCGLQVRGLSQNLVQGLPHPQDLSRVDIDVRGLSSQTTHRRLVN